MSIAPRITNPATLHRRSAATSKDAAGDVGSTFVDVPTFVELQQYSANEMRNGMLVSVTIWAGYFRPDVVLSSLDEVTIQPYGRFTFEGDPWLVRHPRTGRKSHYLARLKRVS